MKIISTFTMVLIGGFLFCGAAQTVSAQESGDLPDSYSLTVRNADGTTRQFDEVTAHMLIPEDDPAFLSVLLKNGRRFLLSIDNRDFEFSEELSLIMEAGEGESED